MSSDATTAPVRPMSLAILTVSTAVAAGDADDVAGALLGRLAGEAGAQLVAVEAVSDDQAKIEACLRRHVADGVAVILTVGGSGLTRDDFTPEATRAVIERDAPGFAEALRAASLQQTPMGMLTRGLSGTAGDTLIINLPGSPKAIGELFGVLAPVLGHAVDIIRSPAGSRALHGRPKDASGRP